MHRIRILATGLPRLLCDIVGELATRQPDMVMVGRRPTRPALGEAVRACRPEVVVVGCRASELSDTGRQLRSDYPRLRILALADDGRSGVLIEPERSALTLEDISPESLLAALRGRSSSNAKG